MSCAFNPDKYKALNCVKFCGNPKHLKASKQYSGSPYSSDWERSKSPCLFDIDDRDYQRQDMPKGCKKISDYYLQDFCKAQQTQTDCRKFQVCDWQNTDSTA